MLNIETKKHDQFTLELKVGYSHGDQRFPVSDFVMNTWVFIPDSLYINQKTYTKSDFYRDTRSHIRLMTPIYSLHELVEADCQPFQLLAASWENYRQETSLENRKELEHQLKMLGNIVRSALRSRGRALALEKDSGRALSLLTETFQDIAFVQSRLRTLFLSENKTKSSAELPSDFRKTDAYIACTVAFYLSKVSTMMKEHHRSIREAVQNLFVSYFEPEQEYLTAQGYSVPMLREKLRNQEYLKQIPLDLQEQSFLDRVAQTIPEGELLLNNPMDGSFLAYGSDGLRVYYRDFTKFHNDGLDSDESKLIRKHLCDISDNDEVRRAVEGIGAHYVLVLSEQHSAESYINLRKDYQTDEFSGISSITPDTPGFELVLQDGSLALYEIVA